MGTKACSASVPASLGMIVVPTSIAFSSLRSPYAQRTRTRFNDESAWSPPQLLWFFRTANEKARIASVFSLTMRVSIWWRRRESNPGPKTLLFGLLRAYLSDFFHPLGAVTARLAEICRMIFAPPYSAIGWRAACVNDGSGRRHRRGSCRTTLRYLSSECKVAIGNYLFPGFNEATWNLGTRHRTGSRPVEADRPRWVTNRSLYHSATGKQTEHKPIPINARREAQKLAWSSPRTRTNVELIVRAQAIARSKNECLPRGVMHSAIVANPMPHQDPPICKAACGATPMATRITMRKGTGISVGPLGLALRRHAAAASPFSRHGSVESGISILLA